MTIFGGCFIFMSKKFTTEDFIKKAVSVHGNLYDYSKVVYINNVTHVTVICKQHGEFSIIPYRHINLRCKCRSCTKDIVLKQRQLKFANLFVSKARKVHGDRYNYLNVFYISATKKIIITCKEHGDFFQTPNHHLNGGECPTCARSSNNLIKLNYKNNNECRSNFINKARLKHDNVYDYSLVDYVKAISKVKIICPIHGIFEQSPNSHLNGSGCGFCKGRFIHNANKHNKVIFIEKAEYAHGKRYDYSNVKYYNARTKVEIICRHHGSFFQAPHLHIRGEGCPICKESHGERKISRILERIGVHYEREKTFDNCRLLRRLRFDFYIPSYKAIIEYHGIQHFTPFGFDHGVDRLQQIQENDLYKKQWAIKNGYLFLEYRYDDKWDYIEKNLMDTFIPIWQNSKNCDIQTEILRKIL